MSANHTPGKWTDVGSGEIRSENGDIICHVYDNPGEEEGNANGHLIVAAPDLLSALQNIDSNCAENPEWIRRVAREAIQKAKGLK